MEQTKAELQAQIDVYEAGLERALEAASSQKLYEDANASLAEQQSGATPTPREQLRRKHD